MDLGLKGKTALVTAASRGLGRAIAEKLAEEGANVALCSRDGKRVQQTVSEIAEKTGADVAGWEADVSKLEDIERLVRETVNRWEKIDILVCNAGGPPGGTLESFDDAAWQRAFETNLLSVVRLIRTTLPHMRQGGRILAIASSSVRQPIPGLILSNTMRAGVAGLMKTLAEELGPRGILVNTVCPGRIDTERVRELDQAKAGMEGIPVESVRRSFEEIIPLGRYGRPEEFARVVAFLASEANTYVPGSTLLIDGGMVKSL
jgi:3-oxoacyl-[acyl-carrier protein] reductase